MVENKTTLKCIKCSYEWTPRGDRAPKVCPKCNSFNWNGYRERQIKNMFGRQRIKVSEEVYNGLCYRRCFPGDLLGNVINRIVDAGYLNDETQYDIIKTSDEKKHNVEITVDTKCHLDTAISKFGASSYDEIIRRLLYIDSLKNGNRTRHLYSKWEKYIDGKYEVIKNINTPHEYETLENIINGENKLKLFFFTREDCENCVIEYNNLKMLLKIKGIKDVCEVHSIYTSGKNEKHGSKILERYYKSLPDDEKHFIEICENGNMLYSVPLIVITKADDTPISDYNLSTYFFDLAKFIFEKYVEFYPSGEKYSLHTIKERTVLKSKQRGSSIGCVEKIDIQ